MFLFMLRVKYLAPVYQVSHRTKCGQNHGFQGSQITIQLNLLQTIVMGNHLS